VLPWDHIDSGLDKEAVRGDADAPRAVAADFGGKPLALAGGEHLAVAQLRPPYADATRFEDDGSRDDRARQRAAAGFIDAGDVTAALPPCRDLSVERGHRLIEAHRADAITATLGCKEHDQFGAARRGRCAALEATIPPAAHFGQGAPCPYTVGAGRVAPAIRRFHADRTR